MIKNPTRGNFCFRRVSQKTKPFSNIFLSFDLLKVFGGVIISTEDITNEINTLGKKYHANKQKKSEIDSIDKELKEQIKELMKSIPDSQKVMTVDKNNKSVQVHKVMKGLVFRRVINPPSRKLNAVGKAKAEELLLETFAGTVIIDQYYDEKEESDTLKVGKK